MGNLAEIRVSEEEMKERARGMEKTILKAKQVLGMVLEITGSTENYFRGKAGETFRMSMMENMKNWERQIKNMEQAISDIIVIAEEYAKAEGENTDAIHGVIV